MSLIACGTGKQRGALDDTKQYHGYRANCENFCGLLKTKSALGDLRRSNSGQLTATGLARGIYSDRDFRSFDGKADAPKPRNVFRRRTAPAETLALGTPMPSYNPTKEETEKKRKTPDAAAQISIFSDFGTYQRLFSNSRISSASRTGVVITNTKPTVKPSCTGKTPMHAFAKKFLVDSWTLLTEWMC